MIGAKTDLESFNKLGAGGRLKSFHPWYIIVVLVGLGAVVYVVLHYLRPEVHPISLLPTPPQSTVDIRGYIGLGVFILLALIFLFSFVALFVAKRAKQVKFAFEVVKLLAGFFTGIASTYFGK